MATISFILLIANTSKKYCIWVQSSKPLCIFKNKLFFSVTTTAFGYIQHSKNLLYFSVTMEKITFLGQPAQKHLFPWGVKCLKKYYTRTSKKVMYAKLAFVIQMSCLSYIKKLIRNFYHKNNNSPFKNTTKICTEFYLKLQTLSMLATNFEISSCS